MNPALYRPDDGQPRCHWCAAAPGDAGYLRYHDTEWGFPVASDPRLFEKLCLEGFQSGLSWRTILKKREAFRAAFMGFDVARVAAFGAADVARLLGDAAIVRHRGKISAAVNNARRCLELVAEHGSLASYIWTFEPPAELMPLMLTESAASIALSDDLKRHGWKFIGPTTIHAFMQSMGLFNDHAVGCITRSQVEEARRRFTPPR